MLCKKELECVYILHIDCLLLSYFSAVTSNMFWWSSIIGHLIFQLKNKCPHLPEVVSTTLAVLTSSADFNNLDYSDQTTFIMEQLLAHFFSEYRSTWHEEDVKWFLETANQQMQWKMCFTESRLSPELSSILSSSETSTRTSPRSTPSPRPSRKSGRKVHSAHHSPRHSPKPSPYHWGPAPQERPSSPQARAHAMGLALYVVITICIVYSTCTLDEQVNCYQDPNFCTS